MSPTKLLSITFCLWWVQTFKYHCKVWLASGLLWCEASSSVRLLGMYVKNNSCNVLLYQPASSSRLHMLIYFPNLQLSFRTLFISVVIESWLMCGSVSFCLTHENVSDFAVAGVKHMCSSQGCNSFTIKEVPSYHLSSVCCLWNNPCGVGLNTDNLESVQWVICSSSGSKERFSSPTVWNEDSSVAPAE